MKQQKIPYYKPNYPKKALYGAALTAAALIAVGGAAGCRPADLRISGAIMTAAPTDQELVLDGKISIPEPTPEDLVLDGEVSIPEPTPEELVLDGDVCIPEPGEEDLVLSGEEMIEEPAEEAPLMTTGVLLMPTSQSERNDRN